MIEGYAYAEDFDFDASPMDRISEGWSVLSRHEPRRVQDASANVVWLDHYRSLRPEKAIAPIEVQLFDAHQPPREETSIPAAIEANWHRIGVSHISEAIFSDLLSQAMTSTRKLSTKAARTFVALCNLLPADCERPVLGITPKGDIVAEWYNDADNVLVLMADAEDNVHFSLYDQGAPLDGYHKVDRIDPIITMLAERNPNPFSWTDA